MARRLYRFMTPLAVLAVALGLWLFAGYGIGMGQGWMHAKLAAVVLLIAYHLVCGRMLKQFERGANTHSHRFYRWFNEVPVILLDRKSTRLNSSHYCAHRIPSSA